MAGGAKRISILNHLEKEIGKWDKDVKQEASTIQNSVVERRKVWILAFFVTSSQQLYKGVNKKYPYA